MLIYATFDDLETGGWLGPSSTLTEETATPLLADASGLVRRATRAALYDTSSGGLPSDSETAAAFRDATCAQVARWDATGVNQTTVVATAGVSSKSMGGRSVTYREGSSSADAVAGVLCSASLQILQDQGLCPSTVWSW